MHTPSENQISNDTTVDIDISNQLETRDHVFISGKGACTLRYKHILVSEDFRFKIFFRFVPLIMFGIYDNYF